MYHLQIGHRGVYLTVYMYMYYLCDVLLKDKHKSFWNIALGIISTFKMLSQTVLVWSYPPSEYTTMSASNFHGRAVPCPREPPITISVGLTPHFSCSFAYREWTRDTFSIYSCIHMCMIYKCLPCIVKKKEPSQDACLSTLICTF